MLVLTRRQGEDVVIAGNIRLSVVAVLGNKVRLGITAPPTVPIVRGELRQEGENAGPAAAELPAPKPRRTRIVPRGHGKRST
jgi:carbon storage regulator